MSVKYVVSGQGVTVVITDESIFAFSVVSEDRTVALSLQVDDEHFGLLWGLRCLPEGHEATFLTQKLARDLLDTGAVDCWETAKQLDIV